MPENKITTEYFLKEYHKFRAIMCRADVDLDDKLEAYKGLWYVYLNHAVEATEDDKELIKMAMSALDFELNMRIGLQARMEIEALVSKQVALELAECLRQQ